jgi:Spy/CpxP family protein refolding chaperone
MEIFPMNRVFTRVLPAATLAVLAAVAPSHAQGGPGGRGGYMRNPVQVMVDSAQSLGLSAEQTQQLTAIAQQLTEQDRVPLDSLARYRDQMGGMRMGGGMGDMTPEQQAAMEHARPFMQQVRDNNRAAMERAMAILTPQQQERIRAMMPQRGMGRGGPGGAPPQP